MPSQSVMRWMLIALLCRGIVFKSLRRIALGHWAADGNTKQRLGHVR